MSSVLCEYIWHNICADFFRVKVQRIKVHLHAIPDTSCANCRIFWHNQISVIVSHSTREIFFYLYHLPIVKYFHIARFLLSLHTPHEKYLYIYITLHVEHTRCSIKMYPISNNNKIYAVQRRNVTDIVKRGKEHAVFWWILLSLWIS